MRDIKPVDVGRKAVVGQWDAPGGHSLSLGTNPQAVLDCVRVPREVRSIDQRLAEDRFTRNHEQNLVQAVDVCRLGDGLADHDDAVADPADELPVRGHTGRPVHPDVRPVRQHVGRLPECSQ